MSKHKVAYVGKAYDVHYIHFRPLDEVIAVSGEGVKVSEYNEWPYGGATLAYIEVEEDGQTSTVAALTQCHVTDRFIKEQGRNHARGRLQSALFHGFRDGSGGTFYTSGLDKVYVLPGPAMATLAELIEEIEDGTGYSSPRA